MLQADGQSLARFLSTRLCFLNVFHTFFLFLRRKLKLVVLTVNPEHSEKFVKRAIMAKNVSFTCIHEESNMVKLYK